MHCFKCGAALPPEAATCPACGAATPYNVTASMPAAFNARPDPAVPGNSGEEQAPPPVVSEGGETPQVERTVLQPPPQPEVAESKSVERTVLQALSAQGTPAPQAVVERTVLQQPPQPDMAQSPSAQLPGSPQPTPPSSSPAWQQPGPSQPLPGSQAQTFPGQQLPQQGPWQPQPGSSQPLPWPQQGPQSYPAWQQPQQPWPQPYPGQPPQQGQPWAQPFPGQQSPQQGPWQPQPGMAQPFPGQPAWPQSYPVWQQPQPGAAQAPQGQPWPQPFPGQPQPAASQPLQGQAWSQPLAGQPQFQSGPVWQPPQMGMVQLAPAQQAFQAAPVPATPTLSAQRRGLSVERILLLIIIALAISGVSGVIYYATAVRPANLHVQATSVAQNFLTAQAQSMTPEGIYTQATRGKPVINDPLSNPNNNSWQNTFECTFTGGAYHVTVNQVARSHACFARGNFSDFAFQVQMTIINGPSGGLVFRSDGLLSRYYIFGITAGGVYALVLGKENFQGGTLNSSSSPAIKAGPNQSNLLTVVARGSNIYLYINKQFVASVHDSTYSSGQIGLLATSFTNPSANVAFSNAQVWQL